MYLVAKEEDSRCSPLNPPILFIFKEHGLKAHNIINNSDTGHARLMQ